MTTLQKPLRTLPIPYKPHDLETENFSCTEVVEDMQHVVYLLKIGQVLCEQGQEGLALLCEEVRQTTQARAHLCLGQARTVKKMNLPSGTLLTLPVQFNRLVYGILCVVSDPQVPNRLALSLPVAQLLAHTCSWLLYTLEQSNFLEGQCQTLDYQVHRSLTKREHEVLSWMYRGYRQDKIADLLCITPATVDKHRQHIYECLGVHCERDALLAAYHTGLLSLVGEGY